MEQPTTPQREGTLPAVNLPPEALEKGSSLWRDARRRLMRNYAAVVGAVLLTVMMLASLGAPWVAEHGTRFEFDEQHSSVFAKPPGARSVPWRHQTFYDEDDYAFAAADADADELVSAAELSGLLAKIEFERFDEDRDGQLSVDEMEDAAINTMSLEEDIDPMTLSVWAGHITAFEERFDQLDGDGDHILSPEEIAAAVTSSDGSGESVRFSALLKRAQSSMMGETSGLERYRVREVARALLNDHCARAEDCPLTLETARLYVDTFPVSQSVEFVRSHDLNGDGQLSAQELPGIPEPHTHLLGTDDQGRDLLTRILYGGRISFAVGLLATFISLLIGVSWGAFAGYMGGRTDNLMMRFVDVLYGLPFMFLVILLMVMFGHKIYLLFIALGAVQWLTMSRIVRGQVLSLKRREFIEAARSIGVRTPQIIFKHLIPNAMGPIIVYATLTVPAVMLEEAFLSFLGLGVQPPDASFGTLVSAGAEEMVTYPWLIFYPGLALAVTLLSLNFLGDGLRDALDPQA